MPELLTLILGIIIIIFAFAIGYIIASNKVNRKWESQIPNIRQESIKQSRAVLGGQFSEQLAPYLPDFPFNPSEARFIGKPIDFLIFKGMDNRDIEEVAFVEIKSGNASLNENQKSLKNAIKSKRVSWHEYRIPKDLTRKGE